MALVETLFSEYPNGAPADWTDFWGTGDFTATVESNAAGDIDFGTKWLKWEGSADDRSVLTWDDLGNMSDACMVTKIRTAAAVAGNGVWVFLRVSGTAGNENAYYCLFGSSSLYVRKRVGGADTTLDTIGLALAANTEYWIKFQAIGTAIKVKVWPADAVEPNDWLSEQTDAAIASGAVGIGAYDATQDYYLDYIGVDSSEIGMPAAYTNDIRFSPTYVPTTLSTSFNFARAMGGQFIDADRKLKGAGIYCKATHNDQVRIAVYSGGSLTTGPQGSTLLKDFGLTAGNAVDQWIDLTTEDDIDIPVDTPIWVVIKGDNAAGLSFTYVNFKGHCGDFQVANGRTAVEGIIGSDPDVAFAATFPAGADTFSGSWYNFRILTEHNPGIDTNANNIECSSEISAPSIDSIRLIAANNVESLSQITVPSLETGWLYPPDISCNTEVTVPSFSVKREVAIPGMESSSEVTIPTLKISHDLNHSDISCLTEVTAAGIYKELFFSNIESSSAVDGATAEWIMVGRMNATLPMITAELSGGHGGFLNAELPMMTAEMRAGARINATLPMITAEMVGKVGINGTLNAILPMITAGIIGKAEVLGQLNAMLPMITARMLGTAGHVGQLNAVIPMITAQIVGYTDITGQFNATIPMIEAYLTGTNDRFATCDVLRYEEPELE